MNGHYSVGDIVLNNWTLTRLLGQDSTGCVFEAVQNDSGLMNKAALKILTVPQNLNDIKDIMADGMDKDSVIEYFKGSIGDLLEEFLLMTKLQNLPNIVSYDEHMVLQHTEGIGWDIVLRMELLTPLVNYTQTQSLGRENVIQLGIDICRALEHCEEFSIVHGDIKPGNVLISANGDFMLGDIGIARTLDKTAGGFTKNAYTAPEIYRGEPYRVSSDIYSLGIVLYWLLNANRTPFMPVSPAPITHSARDLALIRQIQGEPFPVPEGLDDSLRDVVLKACAFNPRKRYASPSLFREDLEAVLQGGEIVADSISSADFSGPDVPQVFDDYGSDVEDEDFASDQGSGFSSFFDQRSKEAYDDSESFDYDEQIDDNSYSQQEPSRAAHFDDELYDDVRHEKSFIANALDYAKRNLAMVSLVAAAVVVVVIALIILSPFGEDEPPPPEPPDEEQIQQPPPVQQISVPDFSAYTYMQLLQNDALRDVWAFNPMGEDYSDIVPEGGIISQTPEAGTLQDVSPLGDRIRVNLVISRGPEPHPLQGIESVEIRWGVNPLPGRADNNPGLTLRLATDPEIVLTARILPTDFDFELFSPEQLEQYVIWESSNEDIFEVTATNIADFSVRITATGTGNASLTVRIGDHEDRITVTVAN